VSGRSTASHRRFMGAVPEWADGIVKRLGSD
jgi:hypothetical protein